MPRKWIWALGIVLLAGVAAAGLFLYRHSATRALRPAPPPNPPVRQPSEISLSGLIRAQQEVFVPAPVDGVVESVYANPGEEVYEGQLLAHIRNGNLQHSEEMATSEVERLQERLNTLQASLASLRLEASRARADADRSKAEFDRAQKAYQRQQMLYTEGATPRLVYEKTQKEFELAQAQYDSLAKLASQAEERVSSTQAELDRVRRLLTSKTQELEDAKAASAAADVRSPVDGLVASRARQTGDEVTPEVKDLFRIAVNLSLLEAVVQPDAVTLERIHPGQEALIQIAEMAGEGIPGRVKAVESGLVVVEFTNPNPAVRPGSTAQVRIRLT